MNFSKEQIEEVTAIRNEFMEKIMMFEHGVYYAKRIFAPDEEFNFTWIQELRNNIFALYLEEMTILDTINVANIEENEFYVYLGQYFERIYLSWKWDKDNPTPWFDTDFRQYKKDIMAALKS